MTVLVPALGGALMVIGIIGLNFLTQFRFSVDLAEGRLRLEQ